MSDGLTRFIIIILYLASLLFLGFFASKLFRGTKKDYMLASNSIGPFLLLMSIFGTTMTAFALVGSSGEAWKEGIGVYGMLASSSGIIHSLCFFLIGVKLWALGRRFGYTTQIQYFRDRLKTDWIGVLLFPILVGLIIPYLLIGVMAGGTVMNQMTDGAFGEPKREPPKFEKLSEKAAEISGIYKKANAALEAENEEDVKKFLGEAKAKMALLHGEAAIAKFDKDGDGAISKSEAEEADDKSLNFGKLDADKNGSLDLKEVSKLPGAPVAQNALPKWAGSLLICGVVLIYVFYGGMRGTAWANAFQTIVFMILGVVTFVYLSYAIGGQKDKGLFENLKAATAKVTPETKLKSQIGVWGKVAKDSASDDKGVAIKANVLAKKLKPVAELKEFQTRKEMSFLKFVTYMFIPLSVGMFPHLFQHWLTAKNANSFKIPVIWHPLFIMIVWVPCVLIGIWGTTTGYAGSPNGVLVFLVKTQTGAILGGFLAAGILAAIMSSLDSQFLCIGTMFTTDIVNHYAPGKYNDKQQLWIARAFIIGIVAVTYCLSLLSISSVFALGVWCFSGFSALFPLVFASVYWKRLTTAGGYACVIVAAASWITFFYLAIQSGNIRTYTVNFGEYQTMPVVWMIMASTVSMIVVSLITPAMDEEHLERFFPTKKVN